MAKKQKRMSRKELRKPDEFELWLKGVWERLEKYWKLMVGGLAAFAVVGIVGSLVSSSMESSRQDQAFAFARAIAPITAPLGEAPDNPNAVADDRERFSDREAALTEAKKRLDAFLGEHSDTRFSPAAEWLRAAVDGKDAVALEAWIAAHQDNPLSVSGWLAVGDAHARAGATDKARQAYRKAADAGDGFGKAIALMAIGDLSNPLAVAGGDAGAAKAAYEEAKKVVGERPPKDPLDIFATFSEPFIYAELDNKLALLP